MVRSSIFLILFFIALPLFTMAAPLPTTGSSILNQPKWNTAFSQMGFSFKLVSDEWVYVQNPSQELQTTNQQINMGFKTLSTTARLSLKTENYKGKINLESYAKKYLRDYNQYGFEVTSSRVEQINHQPAVVIELTQKNKLTQSQQIFFSTDNKVTIVSCIDKLDYFSMTSKMCERLLDGYNWVSH